MMNMREAQEITKLASSISRTFFNSRISTRKTFKTIGRLNELLAKRKARLVIEERSGEAKLVVHCENQDRLPLGLRFIAAGILEDGMWVKRRWE